MKILIVDDEAGAVEVLEKRVREVLGESAQIFTARNGKDALEIVRKEQIDVMFLDVEMPGTNGLDVARKSKTLYPKTNVILCTAYEQYALKAWDLFISGYIVKPASPGDIRKALGHLRTPVVERLRVQCFGYFDIFFREESVMFKRSGSREMLAYLVSLRGATVTGGELCEILHDESVDPRLKRARVRKYAMEIRSTLSALGFDDVLRHTRDHYSINPTRLDCDYYRFLDGDKKAKELFQGEFMRQYSWGEAILARLETMQ